MATLEQLEMLAGRALLDEKFLRDLLDDPQSAANRVGIHLSDSQVERLKQFQAREEDLYQVVEQIRGMRKGMTELERLHLRAVSW